jgi:hypothetical protein
MIIAALKGLIMADDAPTPEQMVPSLLHAVMWACMFGGVDALIAGKPAPVWVIAFAFSLSSHIIGIKWPQIKPIVSPRFASAVEQIASKRLYRYFIYAIAGLVSVGIVGISVYRYYHRNLTVNIPTVESAIAITGVTTHDDFLNGTTEPNGKRPMFNVWYFNRSESPVDATGAFGMHYLRNLPDDWRTNEGKYEDEGWAGIEVQKKYLGKERQTLLPKKMMLYTIFQTEDALPDLLQNITTDKGALYVMGFFIYQDSSGIHESDYCGYLWGDPRVFHPCMKHNTP